MTAPPTLRQIITTPRETLWWSATVLLVGWALLYSSGYVAFDDVAGPAYFVIQQSIGVRNDNLVTLALGLVLLALLIVRSRWTAVSILVFAGWCTWNAIAMYAGFEATGKGWGGGPTWTFFTLFSLLWYVASPEMMRGVWRPKNPRPGTPTGSGSSLRPRARHPRTGTGAA